MNEAEFFKRVKSETDENCQKSWDFLEDNLHGDATSAIVKWVKLGDSLERIFTDIHRTNPIPPKGQYYFAIAIEHVIRQQRYTT